MNIPITITISTPSLSVCFSLVDLLNLERISIEKNLSFIRSDRIDWTAFYTFLDQLTTGDIINFTPNFNELMTGCEIRYPDKYMVEWESKDQEKCLRRFTFQKYIHRLQVCYKFIPIIEEKILLDVEQYSLSPSLDGVIFGVLLNRSTLSRTNFFKAYAHERETSHFYDSVFATSKSIEGIVRQNYSVNVDITYSKVSISRLPGPFDTKCIQYHHEKPNLETKLESINGQIMRQLGKVTPFAHISSETNLPFMTNRDFRNGSILGMFNRIPTRYKDYNLDCNVTYLISRREMTAGASMLFAVFWPNDYELFIRSVREYELTDFAVYCCSSVGIWFGCSALSISHSFRLLCSKFLKKRNESFEGTNFNQKLEESQRYMNAKLRLLKDRLELMLWMQDEFNRKINNKLDSLTNKRHSYHVTR